MVCVPDEAGDQGGLGGVVDLDGEASHGRRLLAGDLTAAVVVGRS